MAVRQRVSGRLYGCYDEREISMEIREKCVRKNVRFDSLKEGEAFYYIGELYMKTSEIVNNSDLYGCTTYNCVSLCNGKIMHCAYDSMVGIARVHIEKEY